MAKTIKNKLLLCSRLGQNALELTKEYEEYEERKLGNSGMSRKQQEISKKCAKLIIEVYSA